jgi:hypothetical protein
MEAMAALRPFSPEPGLAEAANGTPSNVQRYAQDVLRELQYGDFYTWWSGVAAQVLAEFPVDDLRQLDAEKRAAQPTSQTAWDLRRTLSRIDTLYGQGKLEEAVRVMESSAPCFRMFTPEKDRQQEAPPGG